MKCPNCEAPMADDALLCAACGTEYEIAEREPETDPDARLVCVELARSASHHAVVVSLLAAEGIPVVVHNEVGPALRGISDGPFSWSLPYGAVRIMVPIAFEEAARELIAAQLPASAEEDEMGPPAG